MRPNMPPGPNFPPPHGMNNERPPFHQQQQPFHPPNNQFQQGGNPNQPFHQPPFDGNNPQGPVNAPLNVVNPPNQFPGNVPPMMNNPQRPIEHAGFRAAETNLPTSSFDNNPGSSEDGRLRPASPTNDNNGKPLMPADFKQRERRSWEPRRDHRENSSRESEKSSRYDRRFNSRRSNDGRRDGRGRDRKRRYSDATGSDDDNNDKEWRRNQRRSPYREERNYENKNLDSDRLNTNASNNKQPKREELEDGEVVDNETDNSRNIPRPSTNSDKSSQGRPSDKGDENWKNKRNNYKPWKK